MTKKLLYISLIFCSTFGLYAQKTNNAQDVFIEVRSINLNEPIGNATVDLKGYGDKYTSKDGKAFFPNVPEGNYRYSIQAKGFIYYFPNNTIKVTSGENYNYATLTPAPSNLFFVNGKIVDEKNEPIDSVNVLFRSSTGIPITKQTITDEWGHYDFSFTDNKINLNTMFSIDFKKDEFFLATENDRVFNKNQIRLPTIKMKTKKRKLSSKTNG